MHAQVKRWCSTNYAGVIVLARCVSTVIKEARLRSRAGVIRRCMCCETGRSMQKRYDPAQIGKVGQTGSGRTFIWPRRYIYRCVHVPFYSLGLTPGPTSAFVLPQPLPLILSRWLTYTITVNKPLTAQLACSRPAARIIGASVSEYHKLTQAQPPASGRLQTGLVCCVHVHVWTYVVSLIFMYAARARISRSHNYISHVSRPSRLNRGGGGLTRNFSRFHEYFSK